MSLAYLLHRSSTRLQLHPQPSPMVYMWRFVKYLIETSSSNEIFGSNGTDPTSN